jgi:protein-export membrane protein SecD
MITIARWQTVLILGLTAWGFVFSIPNLVSEKTRETWAAWSSWLPHRAVSLGLDLQGGGHLLLQVDTANVITQRLDDLVTTLRGELRQEKITVGGIRVLDGSIVIADLAAESEENVAKILARLYPINSITMARADNGRDVVLTLSAQEIESIRRATMQQSIEIIRRRVDETGTREPSIQAQGENRILVQLPGLKDPERVKALIGRTAKMTFHMVDAAVSCAGDEPPPLAVRCLPLSDERSGSGQRLAIQRRALLTGDMLVDSQPTFDQMNQPVVSFRFNSLGAKRFADATAQNVGQIFAIVLDNVIITAPRINEPIPSGSGQISGNFTAESANDLAILLRAGALPAPLTVIEERSVGPSLGSDSIRAGAISSIVALIAVMTFMIWGYRFLGLLSAVALVANMALLMALLSVLGATLTLPGIAGIVLTIGMAVDANVLIFERIFEERRNGMGFVTAIDRGYREAMSSIIDANVTTLIASTLLFFVGTGPVKGFAVTLTLGVITSMFSAIYLTRWIVVAIMRWRGPESILPDQA